MLLLTWNPCCSSAFTAKLAVPPRWIVRRVAGTTVSTLPGAWACKQSQGAASSKRSADVRRVEQLNDGIFEILFPHVDPDMHQRNLTLPVNQQRNRQRVQPAVCRAD